MSISTLLANLYLHPLDERITKLGYHMMRYADDFVMLCERGTSTHSTGRNQGVSQGQASFSTPIGLICIGVVKPS